MDRQDVHVTAMAELGQVLNHAEDAGVSAGAGKRLVHQPVDGERRVSGGRCVVRDALQEADSGYSFLALHSVV